MSRRTGPPRVFEALLRWSARTSETGSWVAGDLREEYAARAAARGSSRADLWFALTSIRVAIRLLLERGSAGRVRGEPGGVMGSVVQDVRYGLRTLRRSPGFTMAAIATLSLGIGATTAIFAAVYGILLKPLPYAEPDRLVRVEVNTGGEGWYGSSVPEFMDYETHLGSFADLAAYSMGDVTLGDTLSPHRSRAVFATASLLPMLGVDPLIGRFFTRDEETPTDLNYVLLSWDLWQQDYSGNRAIVGSTVPLFGAAYTVLGVMPPGFAFPDPETRAWFPFGINRANPNPRNNHFLNVVGRLRPDIARAVAAGELSAYTDRARVEHPEIYSERGYRARVISLHESITGEIRVPLIVLMSAVTLVLLIACVNVANLLLTRSESRRRELSVRAAMGASGGRLVRQLVTESLILATAGGIAGIFLAYGVLRGLIALAPTTVPRIDQVELGAAPLALTIAVVTVAGLLFGTFPALRATRAVSSEGLARGGRGVVATRSGRRVRRWLVISQIAFAGVLSVSTGAMLRTMHNLREVETGFRPDGVLTLSVSPSFTRYQQPEQRVAYWTEVMDRLSALPGVEAAGATSVMPLTDQYNNLSLRVEGRVTTSIGDAPDGRMQVVTPGLAAALGLRVVRGRFFNEADGPDAQPVVVVSESFANQFWPGQNPIGKTVKVFADEYPWMSVIGVVDDIKHDRLDRPAAPMWYVPGAQAAITAYGTPLQSFVVLRTSGNPTTLLPAVRDVLNEIDPTAPISRVQPLAQIVDTSISGRAFTGTLLQSFGVLALFLACVGVYGVTSLTVSERRGEIGLRKALGARAGSILAMIARENIAITATGAAFGLTGGWVATRLMSSLLFGVGSADALAISGTLFALGLTALVAAAVPAARAARLDAIVSLREEV